MTQPLMRPAQREDIPVLIKMLADDALGATRETVSDPVHPDYLKGFEAIARDPNHILAVLEDETGIVGTLQVSFLPGLSHRGMWRGQIEGVRVASNRRGQKLGHTMIEWAIEQCREKGCRQIQLSTDKSRTAAIRFYEGLGFKPSHEGMKLNL